MRHLTIMIRSGMSSQVKSSQARVGEVKVEVTEGHDEADPADICRKWQSKLGICVSFIGGGGRDEMRGDETR